MHLSVSLVEGLDYTCQMTSMPFTYRVNFDAACIVLAPVDVTCCMLFNTENDSIVVGGSSCIFRVLGSGTEQLHGPGVPLSITVDVLADDEDVGQLVPGTYKLTAEVSVFTKAPNGEVQLTDLDAELGLRLA